MFKGVIDSLVVYLVGKFGYPDEALKQDEEIMKLKKALIEEKLKATTNMQTELEELRTKVEVLNDEKVYRLEQEISRLRHENHHLKQLPPPPTNYPSTTIKQIGVYDSDDVSTREEWGK